MFPGSIFRYPKPLALENTHYTLIGRLQSAYSMQCCSDKNHMHQVHQVHLSAFLGFC